VTWVLPVTPDRRTGHVGRGETFDRPDDVVELPAGEVRDTGGVVVRSGHD
jgi:hypothetical protein